jgi:hypothetical protein
MAKVFMWMFLGLLVSAGAAYLFASNPVLMASLVTTSEVGRTIPSVFGWLTILAPIGLVLAMSIYKRLSATGMKIIFLLSATIIGVSLSFTLLTYSSVSIISCFLSAAAMFGLMAVMGYTTNKNLSGFGRILLMALLGIIAAMVINFFMASATLDYIISIVGVMVFTGLTAYDVQKIKCMFYDVDNSFCRDNGCQDRILILSALTLYLDFLNLFLFLLRLFGNSSDD